MIVWFVSGWEGFAKWNEVDEAIMSSLIFGKIRPITQALNHVCKEKDDEKEVDLGIGPGNRHYRIAISHLENVDDNPDFMQMIGQAPLTDVSVDLLANALPDDPVKEPILIGHIYDEEGESSLKIIGLAESNRLFNLVLANL